MRLRASHGLNLKQGPASALLHEWLKVAHLQDEEMHSRSKTHLGRRFPRAVLLAFAGETRITDRPRDLQTWARSTGTR